MHPTLGGLAAVMCCRLERYLLTLKGYIDRQLAPVHAVAAECCTVLWLRACKDSTSSMLLSPTDKVWSIAKDNCSSLTKPGMLLTMRVLHHQQHACSDLLLYTQHSSECTVPSAQSRKTIHAPACRYAACQNRISYKQLLRIVHTLSTPNRKTKS